MLSWVQGTFCSAWAKQAGSGQAALLEPCPCIGHVTFAGLYWLLEVGVQFLEYGVTIKLHILSNFPQIIFLKSWSIYCAKNILKNSLLSQQNLVLFPYLTSAIFLSALFCASGETFLFSLKATNAPLPVWFCAGSNHWFHGESSFKFPKEGGLERRRCGKKQIEAGRWSTLNQLCFCEWLHTFSFEAFRALNDSPCMVRAWTFRVSFFKFDITFISISHKILYPSGHCFLAPDKNTR